MGGICLYARKGGRCVGKQGAVFWSADRSMPGWFALFFFWVRFEPYCCEYFVKKRRINESRYEMNVCVRSHDTEGMEFW